MGSSTPQTTHGSTAVSSLDTGLTGGPETPEELVALWEEDAPPAAGPFANLASCLVVVAIGVAGIVLSTSLGIGTAASPGPGTWPLAVSVLITVLGLVQAVIGRRGGQDGESFTSYSWITLIGLLTLVVMVLLMPVIGFEVPALLLCIVWMKFLGGESWRSTILFSLLVVGAFYAIFTVALGTSIPHLI